jgi:hypothetical protein
MLPILRILPVGGVLLAILILVLALSPPDGSRATLSSAIAPARGALLDRDRQFEARQYLIHAALKRADELNRLRDLPDTPVKVDDGAAQLAGLPGDRSDSDPEEAASINETPAITIPMEVSEPSTNEPPPPAPQDSSPATKSPERAKPPQETRRQVHRIRRAKTTPPPQPRPFNLFEALFGPQPYRQQPYSPQQTNQRNQQPNYSNQQSGQQNQQYQQYQQYQYQQYQQQPYANRQDNQQSAVSPVPNTNSY